MSFHSGMFRFNLFLFSPKMVAFFFSPVCSRLLRVGRQPVFLEAGFFDLQLLHDPGELVDVGQADDDLREGASVVLQLAAQDLHVAVAHLRHEVFRRVRQVVAGEETQQDEDLEDVLVGSDLAEGPDQAEVVDHLLAGQDGADAVAVGHADLLDLGHLALGDRGIVVLSPLPAVSVAEQELELLVARLAAGHLGEAAGGCLGAAFLPDRVLKSGQRLTWLCHTAIA